MSDALEPHLPTTRYATLELAVERAHIYLEEWAQTKPWRDYLDACFAVACESPQWGQQPAWTQLVEEVKAQCLV